MKEKGEPWSLTKAAQARASAAELDRQARELEKSADSGNWRQRARIRGAIDRLRVRAGQYLATAHCLEERVEEEAGAIPPRVSQREG